MFGPYFTSLVRPLRRLHRILPFFRTRLFPGTVATSFRSTRESIRRKDCLFKRRIRLSVYARRFVLIIRFKVYLFRFSRRIIMREIGNTLRDLRIIVILGVHFGLSRWPGYFAPRKGRIFFASKVKGTWCFFLSARRRLVLTRGVRNDAS